jgi:hypothetical protein
VCGTAAVAAKYACAGGPVYLRQMAANNAAWMTYFIDTDGCPSAQSFAANMTVQRGGWQEDAHTDVVHNLVDALNAFDGVC